ncbi:MAG: hypothetical protein GY869_10615, partial [Planctomycetes bacterium]|nr:hypothetical protein [Planctomycetota bacterium]
MDSCTFRNNEAIGGEGSGFAFNAAYPGQGKGGAIFVMEGAAASMKELIVEGNTAANSEEKGFTSDALSDTNDVYGLITKKSTVVGDSPLTVVVKSLGDSPNDMNINLRSAIYHANLIYPEKLIVDLTGVSGTITLTSPLPILTCNIELIGPGKEHLTISGDDKYRVFLFNGDKCKIKGLTVSNAFYQGGSGSQGGGGGAGLGSALLVNRGTVECENVYFFRNHTIGGTGSWDYELYIGDVYGAAGGSYGESVVGGAGGVYQPWPDESFKGGGDGGTFAGGA